MADLDSLDYQSISSMTKDEALEHLRKIRLSRRIPTKKTKTTRKVTKKKQTVNVESLSVDDAGELAVKLLKLIGG